MPEFDHIFTRVVNVDILITVDDDRPSEDAYKLSIVHMKLEERRRQIEQEKRKEEVKLSRHQEKVSKAAFLQTIKKVSSICIFPYEIRIVFSCIKSNGKPLGEKQESFKVMWTDSRTKSIQFY